jgi:autotransporter-associated beta strand protein
VGAEKQGDGTLILSGNNGWDYNVYVLGGALIVGNDHALGSGVLFLQGGTIESNAGTGIIAVPNRFVVLGPNNTIGGTGVLIFSGTGEIEDGVTLTVANTGSVTFEGILFGPGSLTKMGTGELFLDAQNNYGGGTQLQEGYLTLNNDGALGTGMLNFSGGTLISGRSPTVGNSFTVSRNSTIWAPLLPLTLNGAGTLCATLRVLPTQYSNYTAPVTFSGRLSGPGALTVEGVVSGGGTVTFSGADANTYTGTTTVNSNTLVLNKPDGVTAIAGPLVIGDSIDHTSAGVPVDNAQVKLGANNQLDPMVHLTINAFGSLKKGIYNSSWGQLDGDGQTNIYMGDPPTLTVGFNNRPATFRGVISGPGTVVKVGTGTWTLTGANTYTGGTIINAGTLLVNGAIGAVTVNPGGTLGGTGTTGPVTLSPGVNISPGGATPGILHVQSITLAAGSSFVIRLNGPVAGTGYDQLQVTGTVNLGGASLSASLSPAYLPTLGTAFPIITSTDTLSGTFAGHPDGDTLVLGGTVFQIHYVNAGGSHAVVLTAMAYATTTALISLTSPSVYGQAVTFTATVRSVSAAAGTPTGTVTLLEGSTVLASAVPLGAGGQASFSISTLPAGPHTLTAQYHGSGFAASAGTTSQTVNRAALTVTADDQTKITGEANPPFTVRYSGFVLGEGPGVLGGTLTFSTPATTSSPPGIYAITPGGLTASNYTLTFVSGTLSVLSFAQATTNLVNQVTAAHLDHGLENALLSILQAAIDSFNRGDNTAGENQLGAFQDHVRAQRGHAIDAALADALMAYAQRIINVVPG